VSEIVGHPHPGVESSSRCFTFDHDPTIVELEAFMDGFARLLNVAIGQEVARAVKPLTLVDDAYPRTLCIRLVC
jgi:hypothetical protein